MVRNLLAGLTIAIAAGALLLQGSADAAPNTRGTAGGRGLSYSCGTLRLDFCHCTGSADCLDLKKSGFCDGLLVCTGSTCTCKWTDSKRK